MSNTALAMAIEFHHRYLKLSESSGYALVYDSLKLMLEYIPGTEIGIDMIKTDNEDPDDITQGSLVLSIGTQGNRAMFFVYRRAIQSDSGHLSRLEACDGECYP